MSEARGWTIDELVGRVGLALETAARAGHYDGAPNGRVREVPDKRVIRWYMSIGLVDRPAGGRGRGARYGVRQLRQIIAVKRLQGQGLPLAQVQARLVGIGDDELARLAALPPEAIANHVGSHPVIIDPVIGDSLVDRRPARPARFWAAATPAPRVADQPDAVPIASAPQVEPLTGIRLAPGVLLVLPVAPGADDVAALAEAAGPLLVALADRGLISRSPSSGEPSEGVHG